MSSEAGSTISGFPGISEGGKIPIRGCSFEDTPQLWEWGQLKSSSHMPRAQESRAGVEGFSLDERWAVNKALEPLR